MDIYQFFFCSSFSHPCIQFKLD